MEKKLKSKVLIKTSFSLFLSLLIFLRLNSFSLFLILSATAFFLLSLSFWFSLRPPSFFFLSLSHSLWHHLLTSFSLFLCLCFFASIMVSSSSFHRFVFISQKKDYGDGFYFFLSFVLIIFFCSSLSFFFLYRLQLTLTKTCIWDLSFIYPFLLWISFFVMVSQANWYFSLCFFPKI